MLQHFLFDVCSLMTFAAPFDHGTREFRSGMQLEHCNMSLYNFMDFAGSQDSMCIYFWRLEAQ